LDFRQSNPLHLLVRHLAVHARISADDEAAVLALPYKLRTLEAQSYTVREGDRPDRCAILVSGYAYRHKVTGDGSRQILSLHIPGDALDFQNMFLSESDHNVQMLTRGQVAEIAREPLEQLVLSNPGVAEAVMIATLVEASIFREWALNIGRRDARGRIAHLLCEFSFRLDARGLGPQEVFELPITQEQLADATGLTPVHVNRILKGLQADGLIERDRRIIRFPNWERLREEGDFNSRYLHTLMQHD
jgi:CRP-like cAMP-binding protein